MFIYGEKVVLRAIEVKDNALLLGMINDPDTEMMVVGSSWPVSEVEQLKWFEQQGQNRNTLRCVMELKNEGIAIGMIGFSNIDQKNGTAEVNIKISKDAGRGKGYGTDAMKTLVRYAFNELRLNCLYANILSYNTRSMRMFEKSGFTKDGILRSRIYKGGKFIDLYSYSIIKDEI